MEQNKAAITHSHSTNNVTALTDRSVTRNNVTPETNWSGQEVEADVIVPYESAVDSTILDEIVEAIRTNIFISKSDATKMVLWAAHANVFRSFKATPRLIITAGTRGCGKTVTLNILKAMVNNAITDGDSTPASFYTLSQDGDKAFFLDEVDSWIKGEGRCDLMNSLKSGFNQGGSAKRVEMAGGKRRVMTFGTHSAVALAGIGLDSKLDPAVVERSHIIYLRKALRGDLSVRFDDRKHLGVFQELGRKLLRWCTDKQAVIEEYDYQGQFQMPEHLINRVADCWEPFFAIASVAGDAWYQNVLDLSMEEVEEIDHSYGAKVLKAIGEIYDYTGNLDRRIDRPELAILLERWQDEDGYRPFARWHKGYGQSEDDTRIKADDISDLLRPFGIKSRNFRNSDGSQGRGFVWADLLDAVERHAPPEEDVTSLRVTTGARRSS